VLGTTDGDRNGALGSRRRHVVLRLDARQRARHARNVVLSGVVVRDRHDPAAAHREPARACRSGLRGGPRVVRVALALAAALLSGSVHARVIHSQTSLYQNILVTEDGSVRCMQFTVRKDQRNQSCVDRSAPKHLVFPYARMMLAALLLDPAPTNVLVVGLGGGTLPTALAELYPNASIDVVEIDPAVVVVAKRYFGFEPTERIQVFEHDARVWAKRATSNSKRYDLIMLDAFNGDYIPEHLMTKEYLSETRELLTSDGVLASNTFAI